MKNIFFPILLIVTMVLTFALGSWQIERHYEKLEKNKILAKSFDNIDTLPLEVNNKDHTYHMFNVTGVFDFAKQVAIGPRNVNNQIGRFIYTILYTNDNRTLLVNRGFVLEDAVNKVNTIGVSKPYNIKVILIANKGKKWFVPKNNPEKGSWVYVDTKEIGDFFGDELANYYFNLMQDIGINDGVKPFISQADYKLFNPHYKYAIFWFSIFFTLLIMILIFYKRRNAKKYKNS